MDALIGHSGFVGTNLRRAHDFDACFNSRNINDIAGRAFATVVCAAAPATMWQANREPERDAAVIDGLVTRLRTVEADRFVVISTIAVLADAAAGADESTTAFEEAKAYGRNRRRLEEACLDHFPRCTVLRLPALYGEALKKNLLFDLLNPVPSFLNRERHAEVAAALPAATWKAFAAAYSWDETLGMFACDRAALRSQEGKTLARALGAIGATAIGFTNLDSTYQFYGLDRLWRDIGRCLDAGLSVAHLAPEPIRACDMHVALTGAPMPASSAPLYREDMRTRHAGLWGRPGDYIADRAEIIASVRSFFEAQPA